MTTDFMTVQVHIEAAQQILSASTFETALTEITDQISSEFYPLAIAYPAEGSWNTPGGYPKRWYQRKFGPRWARADGSVGGRNTSERMQDSWISERPAFNEFRMHNSASYSEFVIGDRQAQFHHRHGWLKMDELAAKFVPRIQAIANRVLGRFFG